MLQFASVERRFQHRSNVLYDSMAKRFREKRSTKHPERILRHGRELPFTKDDFRGWLIAKLNGVNGVVQCAYCPTFISIDDLSIDHEVPVSRGGDLTFDNLVLCCEPCNQAKGEVLGESWRALTLWAREALHPDCWQNIFERLQSQFKLARMVQQQRAQKFAKKEIPDGTTQERTEEEGW